MWIFGMKRTIFMTVVVLLALAVFAACAPDSDQGEPPVIDPTATAGAEATATMETDGGEPVGELAGTHWNLVSLGDETLVEGSTISLDFTAQELGGVAGCNRYGGPYTLDGTSFSVGELVMTQMACEGLMDQEALYVEMLTAAESITVLGDKLTIRTPQGDHVYEPAEHVSLEGTDWMLGGIAQDEAIVSTAIDADITATFEGGTVGGSAGCNTYTADYTVEGETLELGEIIRTEMACEDVERNEREELFLTTLGETAAYEIVRDTLTLMDGDGNVLLIFNVVGSGQ